MDNSVSKKTDMMFHLSGGDLLKPAKPRGNQIHRLPLNQTDLENYTNISYLHAARSESHLSSCKPDKNSSMDVEGSKENKLKENRNVILNSIGNKILYEKKRDTLLNKQPLECVATNGSNMTPDLYETNLERNIAKQDLCATLLSNLLNTGSKSRSLLVLSQPLADENSKLDLSTLPKRKNILVAPFCNEINFYEEADDDCVLVNLLTENINLIDNNYKETSNSQMLLRKLLNGLKYYFLKYETRRRFRNKNS